MFTTRKIVGTVLCAIGSVMILKAIDLASKRYVQRMFEDNTATYRSYRDEMSKGGFRQVGDEDLWINEKGAQILGFPKEQA